MSGVYGKLRIRLIFDIKNKFNYKAVIVIPSELLAMQYVHLRHFLLHLNILVCFCRPVHFLLVLTLKNHQPD